jgi:hypothetical protein
VANRYSSDVSILLNQGDGTFAEPVAYPTGDGPISIAIGDLDGINGCDLAVTCVDGPGHSLVLTLLNRGDGTFARAVGDTAGDFPNSLAIGDLDGVNGPDLAVTNWGSNDVSVLFVSAGFPGVGSEQSPYCSVQFAIDNAASGDEIIVAPGSYFETLDFLGKAIRLHSSGGAEVTVINHGVQCVRGEGPTTILEGFTITNSGMYNYYSSPAVTNCTFSNCDWWPGGGMYNENSSPTVANCTFSGNSGLSGGGMYNENSNPTVINCAFSGNGSRIDGAGMANWADSNPMVVDCTFIGNVVYLEGGGGGMANIDSSPTVTNCTFSGNTAEGWGGVAGGTVINCIIWNNTPGQVSSSTVVAHSNIQGGYPGTGNIDADPLFVDPDNGDFRLQPGSPCIDAGHNNAIAGRTDTDLHDNPRFADDADTADTGCGVPATAWLALTTLRPC